MTSKLIKKILIVGSLAALFLSTGCSSVERKTEQPASYNVHYEKTEKTGEKKDDFYDSNWIKDYLALPSWKRLPL